MSKLQNNHTVSYLINTSYRGNTRLPSAVGLIKELRLLVSEMLKNGCYGHIATLITLRRNG